MPAARSTVRGTSMARAAARSLALVSAVAVAGACGGSAEQTREPSDAGQQSAGTAVVSVPRPSASARPTTTAAALFEFVDYLVSGGIAGMRDHLKVYPDGRAVYAGGSVNGETTFTVPSGTVAELRAALDAANLPALPPVSGSPSPDALVHRILYGGQSVRFYDGAIPDPLRPALAILDREMSRGKRPRS